MTLPRTHDTASPCPACGSANPAVFYTAPDVPIHSTLLFASRSEAVTFPRGNVTLGFCHSCGFITNRAFSDEHIEYSSRYEETQGFSRVFQDFHRDLAERLIAKFDLRKKRILEIGCGKGEFLHLLCSLADNTGIGFDPVYVPERDQSTSDRVEFRRDFYTEAHTNLGADLVVCKMTLEHIPDPLRFVTMVRHALEGSPDADVFFQVPDMKRILQERAFWDVYYEHCSYFNAGSLDRLFTRAGFDVTEVWSEYAGQVLMIAARPRAPRAAGRANDDISSMHALAQRFAADVEQMIGSWRSTLLERQRAGQSIVVWGAGSKAVAFLSKIGTDIDIRYAVDVNPYKHGTFLAGTGQEIAGPAFLKHCRPDVVVVMNPVYVGEITETLRQIGVAPEILALS